MLDCRQHRRGRRQRQSDGDRLERSATSSGDTRSETAVAERIDNLHGRIIRASLPHAEVRAIDVSAAARYPGVRAILILAQPDDPFIAGPKGETDMVDSHGRFVWYELMTTDIEIAKTFYGNVVGWGARDASMPGLAYNLLTVGDSPVAGLVSLPEDARRAGAAPHWIGYVGVDDVDAAIGRIKQLGGAVYVPPTDVPNISRFSVVADPQMATLALVKGLKSGRAQSAALAAPGCVGWHELFADDWEKALGFYGEMFGWQKAESHVDAMGMYQGFSVGGVTIGGMFTKPATLPLPFWLYYFNIDDIQAAAKRVEAGGGQILYGPTAVPGGAWIVHCADPQGAIFALLDRRGRKTIGYFYFERVPLRHTADAPSG